MKEKANLYAADVCKPRLGGKAARGYELNKTHNAAKLDVTYHCKKPGVVAVLVSIPMMKPYGRQISFSYVKVCGGFKEKHSQTTVTAPFVMHMTLALGILVMVVVLYAVLRGVNAVRRWVYTRIAQSDPIQMAQLAPPSDVEKAGDDE